MLLDLVAQGDIQELKICKCSTLIIHLLCKRHIHHFQTKTNKQTNNIKKKKKKIPKEHQETLDNFCDI